MDDTLRALLRQLADGQGEAHEPDLPVHRRNRQLDLVLRHVADAWRRYGLAATTPSSNVDNYRFTVGGLTALVSFEATGALRARVREHRPDGGPVGPGASVSLARLVWDDDTGTWWGPDGTSAELAVARALATALGRADQNWK
ncbi:MAG: hypothetical protein H6733_00270 [Alphaproteobacteria bacterium]|nr:hypothetical protein [Alphaproteobacteria bacterium]